MELKDLKLTHSIIKQTCSKYINNYHRIYEKAKFDRFNYNGDVLNCFSDSLYSFMQKNGVSEKFVETMKKIYTNDVLLKEEILLKNEYYRCFMLAAQLEGSELCFGRMSKVGDKYIGCWVERRNFVFDMNIGAFYDKNKTKDYFYKEFGILKDNVFKISHEKLTQSKEYMDSVVKVLNEYDNHKKSDYKLAYNAIKEGK